MLKRGLGYKFTANPDGHSAVEFVRVLIEGRSMFVLYLSLNAYHRERKRERKS